MAFQFDMPDVELRHAGLRVHEKIQVAFVSVLAMQDSPEYARVRRAIGFDDPANLDAVSVQCNGRPHKAHLPSAPRRTPFRNAPGATPYHRLNACEKLDKGSQAADIGYAKAIWTEWKRRQA